MEITLSSQPEVCALMKRHCHASRKLFKKAGTCLTVCMKKEVNKLCFFSGLSSCHPAPCWIQYGCIGRITHREVPDILV